MKKFVYFIILVSISLLLTGCTREGEVIDNSNSSKVNNMDTQIQKLTAEKSCEGQTDQKACPKDGEEVVVLQTNYGDITIKLFDKEAPKTVANFKKLVKEDFYNDLTFHRIIEGFMIQGGDPSGDGTGGPGYTVEAEISDNLSHVAGAVATARQGDAVNPTKASSGSQFYIVHNDTGALGLDGDYTIFGQVVAGQNVVDAIAQAQTDYSDKPLEDVVIEDVHITSYSK